MYNKLHTKLPAAIILCIMLSRTTFKGFGRLKFKTSHQHLNSRVNSTLATQVNAYGIFWDQ